VECRRHYEANLTEFVVGQAMHVRHILFAVTPGVDVHALRVRAEAALMELLRKDVPAERFAQMATELSNCPSGAQGGDLGWVGPDDCAPELSNELFHQKNPLRGMGVHPRLIHTRFGFHVIEVLGRRKGKQIEFEVVQGRIADRLALQLRAKALRDYMQGLAARAELDGVELDPPGSPLIQ
jgi:peptidyl-prolyl cis-trans isomerase C